MSKNIVIGLSFLFATGLALLLLTLKPFPTETKYKQFRTSWAQIFRRQYRPQSILPLSDIIRTRALAELNQSELFLPHYYKFNFDEVFNLQKYALSCNESLFAKREQSHLEKTWIWQRSRCHNEVLEPGFFTRPPFIHPSGQSFTKLALQEGILRLDPLLESTLTLEEYLKIVSRFKDLTPLQISLLKDRTNFVLSENFVFLLKDNEHSSASYEIYTIENWSSFSKNSAFQFDTSPMNDRRCFDSNEQGCWVERVTYSALTIKALSILAGTLLALLGGLFMYYRQKHKRVKKLEDEKRKFALQMLTHELRTPATSLSLLVENIRQNFDSIGETHKENFMKICDEVLRLQNMTKTSYQYLQTDTLSESFKVNLVQRNFRDYFQSLSEKYDHKIELQMSCRELELRFDWFWLDLCLQNLIRNAFEHGSGKVCLQVEVSDKHLNMSVLDEGEIQICPSELFQPFKKNQKSYGLGLGLSIVHKILTSLQVELKYVPQPQTKFKIIISRERYDYTFS